MIFQLGPLGALFAQGNWQSFTTENTILVDNQINDVLIVDDVKWIGTNWGLYTYDNTSWVDYTDVLPHPLVNSISIDKEGSIYVCTLSGIAIYDGISWETITSQNSIITCISRNDQSISFSYFYFPKWYGLLFFNFFYWNKFVKNPIV